MISKYQFDAGKWIAVAARIESARYFLNDIDLTASFPMDDGMNEYRAEIHRLNLELMDLSNRLTPAARAKFDGLFEEHGGGDGR